MNICILTTHIIKTPQLIIANKIILCRITLYRQSRKKAGNYYRIKGIIKDSLAKKIFNIYGVKKTLIIKGFIYIKSVRIKFNSQKLKVKKYIAVKIKRIYSDY